MCLRKRFQPTFLGDVQRGTWLPATFLLFTLFGFPIWCREILRAAVNLKHHHRYNNNPKDSAGSFFVREPNDCSGKKDQMNTHSMDLEKCELQGSPKQKEYANHIT